MPIETEAEWLACVDPRVMAPLSPMTWRNWKRFQHLAIRWVRSVCRFATGRQREYFRAFSRSVLDGIPMPDDVPRTFPSGSPVSSSLAHHVDVCFDELFRNDYRRAAVHAACAVALEYSGIVLRGRIDDPSRTHKKRSKKGREEATATERHTQERLHRDRTLSQFSDEFRDVAGNPFRPVAFDPAWRTESVVGLAAGIDEAGAYERLPILADAIQEAGCEDEQVLTHARGPGLHVRGCWLIDMVLGRFA